MQPCVAGSEQLPLNGMFSEQCHVLLIQTQLTGARVIRS